MEGITLFDYFLKFLRLLVTPISSVVQRKYSEKMRKRLKVSDFTILCNTCMGGGNISSLGKKIPISHHQFMDDGY